jgi:GNAT superfamily N-acetyltransferase
MQSFEIIEARRQDLPSMGSIFARSFHPVNPFMRLAFPDTPLIQRWWQAVFSKEIEDPDCHPLIAISTTQDPSSEPVIGILTLRLIQPNAPGAGFWSSSPWTRDHDLEKCNAVAESMSTYREKIMRNRGKHYLIELLAADHEWKGTGVGKALLQEACRLADAEDASIFVEANAGAKSFYEHFGFREEGRTALEGIDGKPHEEFMMVKSARTGES